MFKCLKNNKNKSFSLIEVMVAITVITVGLVGVMGLIVHNISLAKVSPERVIAVNLAQEGIEVVRNIRDSNWLAGNAFDTGINSGDSIPIFTGSGAQKNNKPSDLGVWELHTIGVGNDWKRYVYYDNGIDDGYKFYGQAQYQMGTGNFPDNWERTRFTRWIEINNISAVQIQVISRVGWTDRSGNPHTVTLEDHLYDWK